MKLTEGLYTDCVLEDQPRGTYRFAKNLIATETPGVLENEPGFTRIGDIVPYSIVGMVPVGPDIVTFSTNNTTSEIGIISNEVYTTVYNSAALGLKTSAPVRGVFYQNFLGERIVAWIDDLNVPRIINIDNPNVTDVNDLRLFPLLEVPATSYVVNDSGGTLLSGTYQFAISYRSVDGTQTNYLGVDKVLRVSDDTQTAGFDAYDGIQAGVITPKSISISITGADTRYDFVDIAVLETIGGVTTAKKIKSIPTSAGTVTATYGGNEELEPLTVDEILIQGASYSNAKAITTLNNRLLLANLTSEDLLDYQQYANNIKINYTYRTVPAGNSLSGTAAKLGDTDGGFQHGEVYAFYIVFILKNGAYSRAFHIPGRRPLAVDTATSQYATGGARDQGLPSTAKKYQVENTTDEGAAVTNMGFWENTDETYPSTEEFDSTLIGGEDLRGEKVRHHRFPTIKKMRSVTASANYGKNDFRQLGINVSDVVIPAEIQEKIAGYQIFYAKRDYANSTVVGQTLFQYGAAHQASTLLGGPGTLPSQFEGVTSTGGNWNLSNVGAGVDDEMRSYTGAVRFHDFDLLSQKPSIAPTYITNQVELVVDMTGLTQSGTDSGKITTGDDTKRYLFVNYWKNATAANTVEDDYIRSITEPKYTPVNVIDGDYNNTMVNEAFVAKINNGGTLLAASSATNLNNKWSGGTQFIDYTYLTCLHQYLTNVYDSFAGQQLVATSKKQLDPSVTTLSDIYGGDTFINLQSTLVHSPADGDDSSTTPSDVEIGFKGIKYFMAENRNNVGLRHEIPGSINSQYYPKSSLDHLYDYDVTLPRVFGYNTDYSKVNDLNAIGIFTPFTVYTTEFPHTIVYTDVVADEAQAISWKNFPAGNRYTMPRHRGEIINIQGINNEDLIIHHEESLFKTKTNRSIQTDGGDVILGSADLFSLPPTEVVSDDTGYAGTQHRFSCLLTKAGYVFVDDQEGKIFLYQNGNLEEISSYGNRAFFRENMTGISGDNPFFVLGYTVAYDEKYNRIIICKQDGANSITVSYDPLKKKWISFHSYAPTYMISTSDKKLYSTSSQLLYRHHTGEHGIYYSTGTKEPCLIDVVMNQEPTVSKILSSIGWVTEATTPAGLFDNDETFDYITVRSNRLCSGRIELEKAVNISSVYNTRMTQREWNFNQFRNVAVNTGFLKGFYDDYTLESSALSTSLDWFDQSRFVDKAFVARLEYSNLSNYNLKLVDVNFSYRISYR